MEAKKEVRGKLADKIQKQIMTAIDDAGIDADVLKVWDGKRYDHISLSDKIEEILMEAKQTFPNWKKIQQEARDNMYKHSVTYTNKIFTMEARDWFATYFGASGEDDDKPVQPNPTIKSK